MRLIIDCSFLAYRSLHTLGDLSYAEKKVGVIYGFLRQILKLSSQFQTNRFVFCWDSRKSYRALVYPPYKEKRHKDLSEEERETLALAYSQFDELREKVLPSMGFRNVYMQTGYEADDLIAWIVARFPDDTVIVSADNDLLQLLVDDRFCPVRIWNSKTKSMNDFHRFKANWFGLTPDRWPRVKAIAGCTSDNIEGVAGVAEISAAQYVAGILKGKVKLTSIEGSKAIIDRNIPLVTLPYNGMKPIKIIGMADDELHPAKFQSCFVQYGFSSLLYEDEVKKWMESFFGAA